jgi:radical SAM superfamily enzyme YgiQ (UPF0313 family)
MKAPGDVLLVACYELGHQPLAVAWPAAFLEHRGYAPAVMDVSVEPFDAERAARAKLVAISVPMHTALRLGLIVAERVRAVNPSAHICFYGLYAGLNADHLLAGSADSVIAGEIETVLVDLAGALERGDVQEVTGLARPGAPARPHLAKLAFPLPSRAALPSIKKYAHLERDGHMELAGHVEASRGCKHHCRHCPIPPVYGGRFFVVPSEVVIADVRQQVEAGATHVTFGDPDFLNGPRHALAVARALHAEFPTLTFDVTVKVEHLLAHRAVLPELAALGCLFVVTAVESLSDTVLRHLDKGHTRGDVLEILPLMRRAGIALRPTWVPFTPWTTLDDYREILDFVEREALVDAVDPVQYGIRLLVPPGSLLTELPALHPYLGPLDAEAFSYRWHHPDPRMDALQREVAALVAEAADRKEDAIVTFEAVARRAGAVAGASERPARVFPSSGRHRPPRLTEAWFC